MNTLGTTVATPRSQTELLGLRSSADSPEMHEGAPDLFGAVLGALTEPAFPEDAVSSGGGRSMSDPATEASMPGQAADPLALLIAVAGAASQRAGNGQATARDPILALVARALPGAEAESPAGPARSASGIPRPSDMSPDVSAATDSSASDDRVATARPSRPDLLDPAPAAPAPGLPAPQAPPSAIPTPPLPADGSPPPGDTTAGLPEELPVPRPAAEAALPARIIETVSEPRPRIVVLAQETHFAPIAPRLSRRAASGTDTATVIPPVPGNTVPPSAPPARPAVAEPVAATPAATGEPGLDAIPAARPAVAAPAPADPSTVSSSVPRPSPLAKPVVAEVTPALHAMSSPSTAFGANEPAAPHVREIAAATAAPETDAAEHPAAQTARPIRPGSSILPRPAPGLRDASQTGAVSTSLRQSAVPPAAALSGPIGPMIPGASGVTTVPLALPSDAAAGMPAPIPDMGEADIASPAHSDRSAPYPHSLAPVAERVATPQPAPASPSTDAGFGLLPARSPWSTDPGLASPTSAASDPASGPSPVQPAISGTAPGEAAPSAPRSFTDRPPMVPSPGREVTNPPPSGAAPNRITGQDELHAVSRAGGSDTLRPMEPVAPASVPEEFSTETAARPVGASIPPVRPGTPAMPPAPHAGAPGLDLAVVIDAPVPTLPTVSSLTREAAPAVAAPVEAPVTGAELPLAAHPGPSTNRGDEPSEQASASPARSVVSFVAPTLPSEEAPSIAPLKAEGNARADRPALPEARLTPSDPVPVPRIDTPVEEASPPGPSAPALVPREPPLAGAARPADTLAERTEAPAVALTPAHAEADHPDSKRDAPQKAVVEAGRVEPARIEPLVLPAQPGAPVAGPARQIAEAVTAALPPPPTTQHPNRPEAEGPLRILTLQLRPMDLGTVLVRMRLRDGQLELHLQASREETAALLRRDGELLTGLLRGAGYQADGATIGQGGQEPFGPTGTGSGLPSSDGQSPPQGRPPSSEPERRPASARAAESQDTREWTNETNPADPGRHDVYL